MISLSPNERLVLSVLKNTFMSDKEIIEKTGLNRDGVWRGLYFLSEKGLADIEIDERKVITLTDIGKDAVNGNMPEFTIEEYDGKNVKSLPDEIRMYLGQLKSLGIITLKDGIIRVDKNKIKDNPIAKALNKITSNDYSIDNSILDILKKRHYVEIKEEKVLSGKITAEGIKVKDMISNRDEIGLLTRDVIEKGDWKAKSFKSYNIKFHDVEIQSMGALHPITVAIRKIKSIFTSMGFEEMVGNYVEDSFWDFDALFQPQDHPSRELADTFYVDATISESEIPRDVLKRVKEIHETGWKYRWSLEAALKLILRTHTTVLSARTLYSKKIGKYFAIGRVFRNESIDFKHLAEFHQIEGIVSKPGLSLSNLMGILKEFYKRLGFERIRFRPSYFPYTEPSLEIEVFFEPKDEWMEIGGAGIFRKEVTDILGVQHPVLAWGLSLERPLMMLLGMNDIRTFYKNDIDWIRDLPYKIF